MMSATAPPATGLLIEHTCPQCGAPVTLEETDRLFQCPYCRVKSYLVAEDVFHYLLPPRDGRSEDELLYLPYWRLRGTHYHCLPDGVQHRLVDVSMPGRSLSGLPPSLGLRPQAMRLRFASDETPGRFVPPAAPAPTAVAEFAARLNAESTQPVFHSELIGETLSLVYAPFRAELDFVDAVLERRISAQPPPGLDELRGRAGRSPWRVEFIPTLCPQCGWDLEGERNTLVLTCRNCVSTWRATPQGLEHLPFARVPGGAGTAVYLPFWRLEVDIQGLALATYADLVHAANLPKIVQPVWSDRPLHFWVPAFKLRPQLFLRAARALTLAQPDPAEQQEVLPVGPHHPVTLPLREATESIKILLALLLRPPVFHMHVLPEISVRLRRTTLLYLPFAEHASEWVHEAHPLAIDKNALRFGLVL